MGSIRKLGKEYVIEFFARGLKYQQRAGADKRGAQRLLEEIEEKIKKGEAALIVRDIDYDIFFKDFAAYAKKDYPPVTVRRYEALLHDFTEFIRTRLPSLIKLSELTPHIVERYRFYLCGRPQKALSPQKSRLVNLALIVLRDIFDYAVRLGYLNDNPTLHIRFVKPADFKPPRTLGNDEAEAVFKSLSLEVVSVVELAFLTGLPMGELGRLQWPDIDFDRFCIDFSGKKDRQGQRQIPLSARAVDVLKELHKKNNRSPYVFGGPFPAKKAAGFQKELRAAMAKMNIEESPEDVLRATFVKTFLEKRVSFPILQKILGERDIARFADFVCFLPEEIKGVEYHL